MERICQAIIATVTIISIALASAFCSGTALAQRDDKSVSKTQNENQTAPNDAAPPEPIIKTFMRAKLDSSKHVLDGVVTGNFQKIKTGAEQMLTMSKAAEWNAYQDPVYAQYSSEFRSAVARLIKEADDNDIDGAGLAYMQLTMNCVSCHKYVRGSKIAKGEAADDALQFSRATAPASN